MADKVLPRDPNRIPVQGGVNALGETRPLLLSDSGQAVAGHDHPDESPVGLNLVVTDTSVHSAEVDITGFNHILVVLNNPLNQNLLVNIYGRTLSGGTNHLLLSQTVLAGGQLDEDLTAPWKFLFIEFNAVVAPTPGPVSTTIIKRT